MKPGLQAGADQPLMVGRHKPDNRGFRIDRCSNVVPLPKLPQKTDLLVPPYNARIRQFNPRPLIERNPGDEVVERNLEPMRPQALSGRAGGCLDAGPLVDEPLVDEFRPIAAALAAGATQPETPAVQTTGEPGSASATTTIDGKQLPRPRPEIRRRDQRKRDAIEGLVAPACRAAQGRAERAFDHDRRRRLRRRRAPLAA